MASGGGGSPRREDGQVLRHLVQTLRSDLNLLSNEARKKYPAVREVRGARWGCIIWREWGIDLDQHIRGIGAEGTTRHQI